jgi:hypothetical protein
MRATVLIGHCKLCIVNSKFKKAFIITVGAIVAVVVLVILFISPITKYLIEKYDEEYTGRKITLDWAYVNPFTGYVYFSNLKIYEEKSDSVFLSAKGLSINFAMLKMLSKTYEITELTLDHPRGIIIQNKKDLNFDDLIKRFSSAKTDTVKSPAHFNISGIKINDGELYYRETVTPINYFIKEVNIESTGWQWNTDTIAAKISLLSGTGSGGLKADFTVNFKNLNYALAAVIHNLDLEIINQYFKALSNYGNFRANLDADIKATGNLSDPDSITAKGRVEINDFHFGKTTDDDYSSFDKLVLAVDEISPEYNRYLIDSLTLTHPYFKYEQYEHLDNLQMMFGEKGANVYAAAADPEHFNLIIEIARYVKVLVKNFFHSYYKINRLAIYNGDLKYNDYALNEKFAMDMNPLYIIADSIDKRNDRVDVSFKSGIQPYGNATVMLSINPKDSADFDMQYHFQKLAATMFNPYIISYTSFPLDRGTIELNGTWTVRKGAIQSQNHLVILDPRVTKKIKNKNTKWLPLPLIMSFVREYGNVIDYEIPITGSLKNPKFHLHNVIFDILGNIFIKPVTTPYRMQVKDIETEIEKALTVKWGMRQATLRPEQEKFVNEMAEFLVKNPDASISVYPEQYAVKEKEYLLFFEAKKKYFLSLNHKDSQSFSEDDSDKVNKMSVKDSLFIRYLNNHINDTTLLFTIQDKCGKLIGPTILNNHFKQLNIDRESAFISCFQKKGVANRVKIHPAENTIP